LKELVVGTGFDAGPKAFPHSILEKQTVVNDTVAGSPALVWFDPDTETALVYERQVDGQVLTFDAVPGGTPFAFLRDRETGTTWSPLSGIAIEGPLRGKALKRIHATNVFWFAWADFYPETVIYQTR
ncbi:MAG: DUF3179 domain-containing protein, partial [Chloroflexi bacterium]|nr:DUF3179 domain-containing protein [Chloroflexota bacterium]